MIAMIPQRINAASGNHWSIARDVARYRCCVLIELQLSEYNPFEVANVSPLDHVANLVELVVLKEPLVARHSSDTSEEITKTTVLKNGDSPAADRWCPRIHSQTAQAWPCGGMGTG